MKGAEVIYGLHIIALKHFDYSLIYITGTYSQDEAVLDLMI